MKSNYFQKLPKLSKGFKKISNENETIYYRFDNETGLYEIKHYTFVSNEYIERTFFLTQKEVTNNIKLAIQAGCGNIIENFEKSIILECKIYLIDFLS